MVFFLRGNLKFICVIIFYNITLIFFLVIFFSYFMRMSKSKLHFSYLFLLLTYMKCPLQKGQRLSRSRRSRQFNSLFLSSYTAGMVGTHGFQIPILGHSHFLKMFLFRSMNTILWPTMTGLRSAGLLAMQHPLEKKKKNN